MSRQITFTHETSRGVEHKHAIPARFDVCPSCDGHGSHLHPDIGGHAYSVDEFAEAFDDDERGEYFRRGGRYDVECLTCHGRRVVDVPDEAEAARTSRGRRLLALYFAIVEREAAAEAERAHERRMGY